MWKLIVVCSADIIPRVRAVLGRHEDLQALRAGDYSLEYLCADKEAAATAGRLVKKRLRKDVSYEIIP